MKKVNKLPDGTEEVLEGDPEELRKYEDLQKSPSEPAPITESPKKPGILHGAEVDGVPMTESEVKAAQDYIRFLRRLSTVPPYEPVKYGAPIWVVSCSICRRVNCQGNCQNFNPPWYPYTITCGTTEKFSLLQQADGTSKPSHTLAEMLTGNVKLEVHTNEHPYDTAVRTDGMYPKH